MGMIEEYILRKYRGQIRQNNQQQDADSEVGNIIAIAIIKSEATTQITQLDNIQMGHTKETDPRVFQNCYYQHLVN